MDNNVLGIDLSSKAIDLVLLDENANRASWTRLTLEGPTAFERARDVAEKMPQPGWYEAHGVYLVAIERPFSASRADTVRLVEGAILAEIPRDILVWEVAPHTWKAALGVPQKRKPVIADFPIDTTLTVASEPGISDEIVQDALDALGAAMWARDDNARGIAHALGLCPVCGESRINYGAHMEACRGPISDALSAA